MCSIFIFNIRIATGNRPAHTLRRKCIYKYTLRRIIEFYLNILWGPKKKKIWVRSQNGVTTYKELFRLTDYPCVKSLLDIRLKSVQGLPPMELRSILISTVQMHTGIFIATIYSFKTNSNGPGTMLVP